MFHSLFGIASNWSSLNPLPDHLRVFPERAFRKSTTYFYLHILVYLCTFELLAINLQEWLSKEWPLSGIWFLISPVWYIFQIKDLAHVPRPYLLWVKKGLVSFEGCFQIFCQEPKDFIWEWRLFKVKIFLKSQFPTYCCEMPNFLSQIVGYDC